MKYETQQLKKMLKINNKITTKLTIKTGAMTPSVLG